MKRLLVIFASIVAMLVLGIIVMKFMTVDDTQRASDAVNAMKIDLMLVRWVVIAAMWWVWNPLVKWLCTYSDGERNDKAVAVYQSQRTKVLLLLIVVEVFVAQNAFGHLLGWLL